MQININLLAKNLEILNTNLNDYDNMLKNYYLEMKKAETNANTNKTTSFFTSVKEEEQKSNIFYNELLNIKKIYTYSYNQYSHLGNIISFDLSKKALLREKISNLRINLYTTKSNLGDIDTYNCPELYPSVYDSISYIENTIELLNSWEREINNTIYLIENTEYAISDMLNNISIKQITETDITPFM